jgi:hypothetical protein
MLVEVAVRQPGTRAFQMEGCPCLFQMQPDTQGGAEELHAVVGAVPEERVVILAQEELVQRIFILPLVAAPAATPALAGAPTSTQPRDLVAVAEAEELTVMGPVWACLAADLTGLVAGRNAVHPRLLVAFSTVGLHTGEEVGAHRAEGEAALHVLDSLEPAALYGAAAAPIPQMRDPDATPLRHQPS